MKLSAQEEYGLRCLLTLARHPGGSLTIPEIAQSEGIAPHSAARYLRILRQAGIIDSERGQHGGYSLARDASLIPVAEVLSALGGRLLRPRFLRPLHRHGGGLPALHRRLLDPRPVDACAARRRRSAGHHLPAGSARRRRGFPRRRGEGAAAGQPERLNPGAVTPPTAAAPPAAGARRRPAADTPAAASRAGRSRRPACSARSAAATGSS